VLQVYGPLRRFVAELVPTWRITRIKNLALLASALLMSRSLSLSELARAYPGGSSHHVRKKRLWRFLENQALDLWTLRRQLTYLALHTCGIGAGQRLPILVDFTYWDPYAVLAASVPRAGRALPIHWSPSGPHTPEQGGPEPLVVQPLGGQPRVQFLGPQQVGLARAGSPHLPGLRRWPAPAVYQHGGAPTPPTKWQNAPIE
jgi:hypothetical protein